MIVVLFHIHVFAWLSPARMRESWGAGGLAGNALSLPTRAEVRVPLIFFKVGTRSRTGLIFVLLICQVLMIC